MIKKMRHKQLNNKGFSLVEVLIAMIILGIAIGPILSSFVTALRINGKAKEQQRLNAAAQSVMEGFKAFSINELEEQFDKTNALNPKIYNIGNVDDANGASVSSLDDYYASVTTVTPSPNPSGYVSREKSGEFFLDGMNYQGVKYDAKITVSPYISPNGYDGSDIIEYIENFNGYQDCVYLQSIEEISQNYYSLLTLVAAKLNELDKIYGYVGTDPSLGYNANNLNMSYVKVERNSKIVIDDTKVNIKTVYKAQVDGYPYYNNMGLREYLTSNFELTKDEDYYNNTATGAELNNVFLFIYPAYKVSGYPIQEDKFDISYVGSNHVGSGSTPMEVFFVKQRNTAVANLELCENSYSPAITLTNVSFYHNLSDNLAGGSTTGAPYFSTIGTSDIVPGISYKVFQTLLYEVKIELFEDGSYNNTSHTISGEPLYTLTGTKNDN